MAVKKILVVEDDPVNAHVLRELFDAFGYRTVLATSGPQGIALFHAEMPDLVIVDVLLPHKNGFEVCHELKLTDAGRRTPLFLMSAVLDDLTSAHERLDRDMKAQAYFVKPFDIATLLDNVQFYVGAA